MEDKEALDAIDFDLAPNVGIYTSELDSEQVQEENEEKAEIQASKGYIHRVVEWLDEEIKLTDSIDGLDLESQVDIQAQILARQLLKAKLRDAKLRLQTLIDTYL